jgi:uncharacterized protein involved in response to NO
MAIVAMLIWMLLLIFNLPIALNISATLWHAHEMVYGYAMAVIAGFLLTAVTNWTGRNTVTGLPLICLLGLWLVARILPFCPHPIAIYIMAAADISFGIGLGIAISLPIIQARAWKQTAVLAKVMIMVGGNTLFYTGLFGWVQSGTQIGLYIGFYLIIALILTMARRLIPFFTEHGVGYAVKLDNRLWLDIAALILFLVFFLSEVIFNKQNTAAIAALALFLLHGIRVFGWYTPGIWRKPLIWGLFIGYLFIILAFPLYAAAVYFQLSPFLSLHAFAMGGIGLITLSMLARVSLGHTGRNVHHAPAGTGYLLAFLAIGTLFRVIVPLLEPARYTLWLACSQLLWILSFTGFMIIYAPMLFKARIDGKFG